MRDFQAAFRARKSLAGQHIVLYGTPNSLGYNRLGLVVSRRLGGAVLRHRFKRLVREAFRTTKSQQPQGWDWLVLPKLAKKGSREQGKRSSQTREENARVRWTLDEFRQEIVTLMRAVASRSARHRG